MESQVLDSALEFIQRAARDYSADDLAEDLQLKHSTIQLYFGIELVLKARLIRESPALIWSDPKKYEEAAFQRGDFGSARYDELVDRLEEECDETLPSPMRRAFDRLRQLRNKYVHFVCAESRSVVSGQQLDAWHHVLELIKRWFAETLTDDQQKRLDDARSSMMRLEEFLDARLKASQDRIEAALADGHFLIECPQCFRPAFLFPDDLSDCVACECEMSAETLAESQAYRDPLWRSDKDHLDDEILYCDRCGMQAVAAAHGELVDQVSSRIDLEYDGCSDYEYLLCFACGSPSIDWWKRSCSSCGTQYVQSNTDTSCPVCHW